MTVTADNKRRVVLPTAEPGDCFELKVSGNEFHLTLMKPAPKPGTVRLVKGPNGYLVGVGERTVTEEEVRKALDEFP